MRYRATFLVGLAAGYVLGSRAGRERYEQIKRMAQRFADSPAVQEAAGVMQAQATRLFGTAKKKVGERVPFFRHEVRHDPTRVTATPSGGNHDGAAYRAGD